MSFEDGTKKIEVSENEMSFPRRQGQIYRVLDKQMWNNGSSRESWSYLWSTLAKITHLKSFLILDLINYYNRDLLNLWCLWATL